ncbi:MAG TPA: 3-dehydroquinate synthase [Longimicrobiaceae bacterium]|nr:3-dehydroquinate synthase [Longimicrobiaceae bacterium]
MAKAEPGGPSRVTVSTTGGQYDILIGAGLFSRLAVLSRKHCEEHRYAIVADDRVADLYGARAVRGFEEAGAGASLFTFRAGEANKNRATWADLTDRMLAAGMGRDTGVIALGGGVTGDLAGFVAATYMRGLPVVQVPTTLLAMIDSSVGGKTGVDTAAGKNLVGAFLQPRLVLADPEVLATLPVAEVRAGLAEAIKHGAIADEAYFDWISGSLSALLAGDVEVLSRLIRRSVEIKAEVVGRDEREAGPRKMLNFGHTFGHAVEALSGFRLLHGEAIAIGMAIEARLGERLGITAAGTADRLARVLSAAGLPTRLPTGMEPRAVVEATRSDKKARGGRVEYALLERIGAASAGPDGRWGWGVEDGEATDILNLEC